MTEIEKLLRLIGNLYDKINRIEAAVAYASTPSLAAEVSRDVFDHAIKRIEACERAHNSHAALTAEPKVPIYKRR